MSIFVAEALDHLSADCPDAVNSVVACVRERLDPSVQKFQIAINCRDRLSRRWEVRDVDGCSLGPKKRGQLFDHIEPFSAALQVPTIVGNERAREIWKLSSQFLHRLKVQVALLRFPAKAEQSAFPFVISHVRDLMSHATSEKWCMGATVQKVVLPWP